VSWWRSMWLVIERELRESFRRRAVWLTAGLLLLATTAAVVVPELVSGGSDHRTVVVVADHQARVALDATLGPLAAAAGLEVRSVPAADRHAATRTVEGGDADAAAILTANPPVIVVDSATDDPLVPVLRQALASSELADRLAAAGLSPSEVAATLDVGGARVEELHAGEDGRRFVAVAASIVVYILLMLLVSMVANGVAIEKSNRISEVLLAIVPPRALLFGKVVGVSIVGLFTLAVGMLPVVVRLAAGAALPEGTLPTLAAGAAWFALGIALYLTTAGALGALVDRQEELGAVIGPLSAVLIVAYLVGQSAPESALATVLAYVPLTSPMVMPSRIALGVASPVEIACSLALGVATVLVVARLAVVVYRRAIVRTGRRVRLREVLHTT
jgi:ABC-2 type transport system permease protein